VKIYGIYEGFVKCKPDIEQKDATVFYCVYCSQKCWKVSFEPTLRVILKQTAFHFITIGAEEKLLAPNITKYNCRDKSDGELFALLRNMKEREEAFAELYRRHSQKIYLYCAKILWHKQSAEDAFQETFMRFIHSAEAEKEMTNLSAYLLRIARNICLQMKESQRRRAVTTMENIEPQHNDRAVETLEFERIMSAAMATLNDEQREAFVLQVYDGLSYQEIADIMEVPVTTVRNWLARSKRRVAEIVQPYMAGNL